MNFISKKTDEGNLDLATFEETNSPQGEEAVDVVTQDVALNCKACGGQGLKSGDQVCPECQGTGKSQSPTAQYAVGTQILTQEGSFIVNEQGELVKQG